MTSANAIRRVIDIDGAPLFADARSGAAPALVFLPDQVASHITTFTTQLNALRPR